MKLVAEGAAGWTKIWEQGDELRRALMQQEVLNGFITPDCNFAPTSRLKVPREPVLARGAGPAAEDYEHELASGAQVTPHYACRALVKSLPGCASAIVCREYRPTLNLRSSPHVPLRAAFVLSPAASPPLPLALQEGGGGNEEDIMMVSSGVTIIINSSIHRPPNHRSRFPPLALAFSIHTTIPRSRSSSRYSKEKISALANVRKMAGQRRGRLSPRSGSSCAPTHRF